MTNDVEKIKIHVLNSNIKTYDDIRKAYLKGDMYVAQDLLTEKLLNKLLKHKKNGKFNHVDSIIAEFEPTFINMGLEIPENVLRLKEDPADIIR